jgi:hypothetical protein
MENSVDVDVKAALVFCRCCLARGKISCRVLAWWAARHFLLVA